MKLETALTTGVDQRPASSAPDPNIDLLRAIAIVMVLVQHVWVMWPIESPRFALVANVGGAGVNLFFMLSGWLVGGLLWREMARDGAVSWWRFVARRLLRLVPPYLVALAIAYGGVAWLRGDAFHWSYLVFAQNYLDEMPFYLVSWSLCVEVHFYALVPVLGALVWGPWRRAWWVLWLLPMVPYGLRLVDPWAAPNLPWGYAVSASHLRCEGILLGVAASYTAARHAGLWARIQAWAAWLAVPVVVAYAVSRSMMPVEVYFYLGRTFRAVASFLVVAAVAGRGVMWGARWGATRWLAAASFSLYLTHSIVLQGDRLFLPPGNTVTNQFGHFVVWMATSLVVGAVFHRVVEVPTNALRDRLVARRAPQAVAASRAA